tara:strand:+ start:531 stop:896 length:366 start_codon:yes stop_codon:yes gene_type:complete
MKDQNTLTENESKWEKWDRGKSLFLESLYKADHHLRGCAHNQKCYNELMEIREEIIDLVRTMENPHLGRPARAGDKNNLPPPKTFNGISVYLLRGTLGPSYMKGWTEDQVKEYEEWVSTNA